MSWDPTWIKAQIDAISLRDKESVHHSSSVSGMNERISFLESRFKKFTTITTRAILFLGLISMISLIVAILK